MKIFSEKENEPAPGNAGAEGPSAQGADPQTPTGGSTPMAQQRRPAPAPAGNPGLPGPTNHVSARLSEGDKDAIKDAIQTIRERLHFLKEYTEEDRQGMMHLGKVGRNFIGRALDLVQNSPGILPRSFDEDEFANDALLYAELGELAEQLSDIHRRVVDTENAVGTDAFTAALVVYQSGKMARAGAEMDGGLPGLDRRLNGNAK
ncbi:MAG: hypothetical protein AAF191_10170 [Verrucomicrobiota bacterium]